MYVWLMKSVVSLRYHFCALAIGWRMWSIIDDIRSVGPSEPEIIGLPVRVSLRIFVSV